MKISDKMQMRIVVGGLLLTAAALVTVGAIMLPKLKKQEKQITELLNK